MLELAAVFGDHMVLQRNKKAAVFGTAFPGSMIRVSFREAVEEAQADENGRWICYLPPQEAGAGDVLTVSGEGKRISCTDVAVGDVFFAGGQSNMEYYMKFDAERRTEEDLLDGLEPDIRFFDVPKVSWEGELERYDYSPYGKWRILSREDLPFFSAVGYYFLKRLHRELDVPVAVICCTWGGSNSSAWLPEQDIRQAGGSIWLECYQKGLEGIEDMAAEMEAFKKHPRSNPAAKLFDPGNERMMYPGFSREEQLMLVRSNQVQNRPLLPCDPWRPTGLYHYMIRPLIPYTFKAILWYQGESDSAHPAVFEGMFRQNIRRLRTDFGPELPFFFVQLAPFRKWLNSSGENYPILRAAQDRVAQWMPDTWMVSSGDAGMEWDIHPKHKRKIGDRMALLALGHLYGRDICCDAPGMESCKREGCNLRIRFTHAEGLHIQGKCLNALEVSTSQDSLIPKETLIRGEELILSFEELPRTGIRVDFAQTSYYKINLYNRAEIPAIPFTALI